MARVFIREKGREGEGEREKGNNPSPPSSPALPPKLKPTERKKVIH